MVKIGKQWKLTGAMIGYRIQKRVGKKRVNTCKGKGKIRNFIPDSKGDTICLLILLIVKPINISQIL